MADSIGSECRSIDVPTVFKDFDDYWSPFLGGQGPAPTYCATLADEKRTALREKIRARLPVDQRRHYPADRTRLGHRGVRPGVATRSA